MLRSFCLCEETTVLSYPSLLGAGTDEGWEALQLRMEQRKAQLERGYLLVRFHTAVRAFFPWEGCMCVQMCTCTEAPPFWRENVSEGARARVRGPGRAGMDGGRETK